MIKFNKNLPHKINFFFILILLYFITKTIFLSLLYPIFRGPDEPDHISYVEYIYHNHKRGYYEGQGNTKIKMSEMLADAITATDFDANYFGLNEYTPINKTLDKIKLNEYSYKQTTEFYKSSITATSHPTAYYWLLQPLWYLGNLINLDFWHTIVILRLFSIVLSCLGIYFFYKNIYLLAKNKIIQNIALIILICNPTFTHISATINNDNLLFLITNLSFYLFYSKRNNLIKILLLSLTISIGFNTKLFFLPTGILLTLFQLIVMFKSKILTIKDKINKSVIFIFITLSLSLPWYIQNIFVLNNWTGIGKDKTYDYTQISHNYQTSVFKFFREEKYLDIIYNHFWGLFGWGEFKIIPFYYKLIVLTTFASIIGLFIFIIKLTKDKNIKINFILFVTFIVNFLFVVSLTYNLYQGYKISGHLVSGLHGRYFFSAFLSFALLFSTGIVTLFNKNKYLLSLLMILLINIDLSTILITIINHYYG